MSRINNVLEKLNYKYDTLIKDFGIDDIEVYTAYKSIDDNKEKVVAKYLILDLRNIKIKSIIDDFDSFQKKFIAEIFYSHRDDIRWNIYTFIVVDSKEYLPDEIYELENDENYSRKFIFDLVELEDFLENGFLGNEQSLNQTMIKTDFTLDWNNELSMHGLNGCLYNKMKNESIDNYINEAKPIRPAGRPVKNKTITNSEDKYIIKSIKNIILKNYRNHCFKKEFSFSPGLINLISGSNGSGKSSICEAISLGMSGGNNSVKKDNDQKVKLTCINVEDETVILTSTKTPEERRKLDLTWYGTTTTGSKSRLYENFTIFNYIQPNTIFSNTECNLQELLKNVIYGAETTRAWKNIQNYKGKFEGQRKKINKKRQELKDNINELKNKLLSLTDNNIEKEIIYKDDYDILLALPEDLKYVEKLDIFNLVDYDVTILEKILDKDYKKSSMNSIMIQLDDVKERNNQLRTEKNRLEKFILKEQQLSFTKNSNSIVFEKLNSHKNEIEKINCMYHSLYNYKDIDDKKKQREFVNEYYNIEAKYNRLNELLTEYEHLKMENCSVIFDSKSYESKLIIYDKLLNEQKKIENRLNEKEKESDLTKKISDNIFKFAIEYQNIYKENSKCPLCGKDYKEPNNILKALDNTRKLRENMDSEVDQLISQNQKYKNKIREIDSELTKAKNQKMKYKEVEEFINRAKMLDIVVENSVVSSVYSMCSNKADSLLKKLIQKKDTMNFIKNIRSNQLYIEYENQDITDSFSAFIKEKLHSVKYKIDKKSKDEKNNDTELTELRKELLNKQFVDKQFQKTQDEVKILEEIMECVEHIRNYFSNYDNDIEIKKWCRAFCVSKNILAEKVITESNNKYKLTLNMEVAKAQKVLKLEEEKLIRCNNALKVFDSLISLDDNMSRFIESNARRIERIFKMIHRPEEFTDLVIGEGAIKFVRKSTKEVVDIANISTGQAMALVFAVTICLHFSSKRVPYLLVFDEPVANLDDLHIMNLVDMLKEIAMMGVQIFITTANDQVATYFRRKFSCFTEKFKHLEIQRTDENPSVFTEKTYLPYKESAMNKKLIAL